MHIGNKKIGTQEQCFLIAEIAQAHNGSKAEAHKYIDLAAKTGADAVKFQTHIAEAEPALSPGAKKAVCQPFSTIYLCISAVLPLDGVASPVTVRCPNR